MTGLADFQKDLQAHKKLCEELLVLAEREGAALRSDQDGTALNLSAAKKNFLAQLSLSLDKIRQHRVAWLKVEPALRQAHPEMTELLRENQNLIMKILVIDRENEKALLRKGLVPNRHLPPANRQRPHFVADLYRRNSYA
jgi:hypothetical protein